MLNTSIEIILYHAVDGSERMQCREPTAKYGCTQWQPEPPLANSDDVLEEKRQTLENLYQQYGKSGADRGDVCALMKETYYLQRKHINGTEAPSIKDLKSKWPYRFVQKHIFAHFEELTSIPTYTKGSTRPCRSMVKSSSTSLRANQQMMLSRNSCRAKKKKLDPL